MQPELSAYETADNPPFLCFYISGERTLCLAATSLLFAEHTAATKSEEEKLVAHFVTHVVELRGKGLSPILYALQTARLNNVRCGACGAASGSQTLVRQITASLGASS